MLQSVRVPTTSARPGSCRIAAAVACAAAASLLAVAGCGTTDLRPTSGSATLAGQPSATLSSRVPCFIKTVDGKGVDNLLTAGLPHTYVIAPGIHTIQIWYNDGQKYSTVRAEIGLVVAANHTYHAEGWPPVFFDDTTNQRAQQSLRGAVR